MEMTPKQKAKELVYKFDDAMEFATPQRFAKKCALIACRELKRQWIELNYIKGPAETNYWDSVKEEIKKL